MHPSPTSGPRKILFHHIPKTAGTALIAHALGQFGPQVCTARYDEELTDAMIADDTLVFYHGHFSYGQVCRFRTLVPDAFIFTFLRHPFARVLSQYRNWIDPDRVRRELDRIAAVRGEDAHLLALRTKFEDSILGMTLDAFLASEDADVAHAARNLQAQYLTEYGPPAHQRFARAVPNALLSYDFVGLQDFYVPCLRIVEAKCRLPDGCLGGEQRANISERDGSDGTYRVTAQQLGELERHNAYDLALFYAIFVQLYRDYGDLIPEIDESLDDLGGVRVA